MICSRCLVHPAQTQVANIPMCATCAAQSMPRVGAFSDIGPEGVILPPVGVAEALKQHGVAEGVESGRSGGGIAGTISETGKNIKEGAKEISRAAIIIGIIIGGAVIYSIYRASKTAEATTHQGLRILAEHPHLAAL